MYISKQGHTYYNDYGEQCHTKADYLLFMVTPETNEIRAIVRKVAMHQWGHWMVGVARIAGESVTVRGSLGNDGLPKTVPQHVWNEGIPIPQHVYKAWASADYHSGDYRGYSVIQQWARENIGKLVSKHDNRSD